MQHDHVAPRLEVTPNDGWDFSGDDAGQERVDGEVAIRPPVSYRQALGDEPIRVGLVEFRIMRLLASRPYHAFTRQQIAGAVSAENRPLAEESVDAYVASLRNQLGVFHDYVQAVPYVGYRFKA